METMTSQHLPNKETIAAMKEAREGNLKTYSDARAMLKDILG
jgi:hypothetical protein